MDKHKKLLRPRVQYAAVGWVFVFSLLGISLWIGSVVYRHGLLAATDATKREQARAKRLSQAVPIVKAMDAEDVKQWEALKAERSFPWDSVFHAVESAATTNIELLEFMPDKKNRRMFLRGEARNNAALIAYLDALTLQPQLRDVHLVRRQVAERGKLITVAFEIRSGLN